MRHMIEKHMSLPCRNAKDDVPATAADIQPSGEVQILPLDPVEEQRRLKAFMEYRRENPLPESLLEAVRQRHSRNSGGRGA